MAIVAFSKRKTTKRNDHETDLGPGYYEAPMNLD